MEIPIIDTKNSNTINEKYNRTHYPEFYQYLDQNYPKDILFKEKLYWYFNNISEYPVCPICGNRTRFITYGEGYKKYCSGKCASKDPDTVKKVKQTCLEKYGVDNPSKSPEVLQKICKSNIDKFGVPYHSQLESAKKQTKETCMERYGGPAPMSSCEVRNKSKQTRVKKYGDENYNNREQSKKTCFERYGVENPMQNKKVLQKAQNVCIEKYGGISSMCSVEVREKAKQTKLKRYGDAFFTNSEKIMQTKLKRYGDPYFNNREKSKKTNLVKYGTDHPMKSEILRRKMSGRTYKKTLEKYSDIIDWTDTEYICKCPHSECNKCQEKQYNISKGLFLGRKYERIETCTHLLPEDNNHNRNTTLELFVQRILDKYNIQYITNTRKILKGKELDIYIPDKKLAIECNGILWHSQYKEKDKIYHFSKWNDCRMQNIQLLTIWEDQILNYPKIVESVILNRLGIFENQINSDKCSVGTLDVDQACEFLNKHSLSGIESSKGSVRLGLYHKDELICVMTFGKKHGSKNINEWNICGFCSKLKINVVGAEKKLVRYFINHYSPTSITYTSNNDIEDGYAYKKIGFRKFSHSISYWYIDKKMKRYHRHKFRKSELVKAGYDKNKTEFDITLGDMGLYRIYDSGQTKWIWSNSQISR